MKNWIFVLLLTMGLAACEPMDDNYKGYLENIPQYSPKITNLTKVESIRTIDLQWDNPPGDLAQKIKIDTGDTTYVFNEMIDHCKLEDLEIKGYLISVFTIDKYGNLSVPESISAFPGTPTE